MPWSRGVDITAFKPRLRDAHRNERPVWLYAGRVAIEKNIKAFLDLDLPGSKWVVGGGPQLKSLQKRYPGVHFFGSQIVLGHDHIGLAHAAAVPSVQRHVGRLGIGAGHDQLGSRFVRHREQQLVLHLGKEEVCGSIAGLVIGTERKQIPHLLVETLVRSPDLADAGQQLVKVIPATGVLEAFVIHDEAFDQVFGQMRCGPLAELRATG